MEEILHQLIGSSSHYLQSFIHPRWYRISAINSKFWEVKNFFITTFQCLEYVSIVRLTWRKNTPWTKIHRLLLFVRPGKLLAGTYNDHPIEKENHIPSTSIFGFKMLIFKKLMSVKTLNTTNLEAVSAWRRVSTGVIKWDLNIGQGWNLMLNVLNILRDFL